MQKYFRKIFEPKKKYKNCALFRRIWVSFDCLEKPQKIEKLYISDRLSLRSIQWLNQAFITHRQADTLTHSLGWHGMAPHAKTHVRLQTDWQKKIKFSGCPDRTWWKLLKLSYSLFLSMKYKKKMNNLMTCRAVKSENDIHNFFLHPSNAHYICCYRRYCHKLKNVNNWWCQQQQ